MKQVARTSEGENHVSRAHPGRHKAGASGLISRLMLQYNCRILCATHKVDVLFDMRLVVTVELPVMQ